MDNNVKTWADGFGRWHAEVPDTPRGPSKAVTAIACEIWDRNRDFTTIDECVAYVSQNIISIPSETPGRVHFAEYAID